MNLSIRMATAAALLIATLAFTGGGRAAADAVTPQAQRIVSALDGMGVETKWIAGAHIHWESGLPTGVPETSPGKHTHCSAFVASAAKKLGVYILRPPEHGQKLLANAQNEWLAEEGANRGWRKLTDAREAQAAKLVVLVRIRSRQIKHALRLARNHDGERPFELFQIRLIVRAVRQPDIEDGHLGRPALGAATSPAMRPAPSSSARTVPANPPSCASSPASSPPREARSTSSATFPKGSAAALHT